MGRFALKSLLICLSRASHLRVDIYEKVCSITPTCYATGVHVCGFSLHDASVPRNTAYPRPTPRNFRTKTPLNFKSVGYDISDRCL